MVLLLDDKFSIDLKIFSYLIPLFSKGFFKFLILVLKNFLLKLDGSLIYVPKVFFDILIKNFFLISSRGRYKLICPFILLIGFIADKPLKPLPLESLIKKVSTWSSKLCAVSRIFTLFFLQKFASISYREFLASA